jgi:glycosyltransferase involved in cell wall biosynthesis
MRVIGLPATGHVYQDSFYSALRAQGVEVVVGYFAGRWLLANVRAGDILHLHWPSFFYASPSRPRSALSLFKYLAFLKLLQWRGARIVWTAHNLYPHLPTRLPGADRLARLATTRWSECILAHGMPAVDAVAREFGVPHSKIRCIRHGNLVHQFPSDIGRDEARQRLGIAPQARVLMLFGSLEPYKNVPLLMRAFDRARAADEELWIVGRCKHESLRLEIAGLAGRIRDVHVVDRYVADEEIQHYLNAADAVVLPYRDGLTSAVAILAISFGLPIIAPNVGCFSSVVDAASGWLYDTDGPDNEHALAEALRSSRQTRFDSQAIKAHASRFRWEDAAQVFIDAMRRPG